MTHRLTLGILATGAGTGIATAELYASLVRWTLRVGGAFGSTRGWSAIVIRHATADGLTLRILALSIGTARRGLAGIHINGDRESCGRCGEGCVVRIVVSVGFA